MEKIEAKFDIWDYTVLIIMLLISSSIGIYYRFTGGKQKTTQEYLLADKNMSILPVAFSLMASFMSAITLLGVSSENYMYGTHFIIINLSYVLSTPIASYLYLPVFFKLQATSTYEYLEKRFGHGARLIASLVYSVQMIFYMGIVVYAPALALEALTGINKEIAILAIGIVCTFYSTIGGMKAVLITDVFQSLLMFAAVFSVIFCAALQTGGVDQIWEIAKQGDRLEFFNFSTDPTKRHTWWSLIIGGSITYLSLYAVNQTQVQRYLTVKDLSAARKTLWLNLPILILLSLSTSFSGLAIYSKYHKCDPLVEGRISSVDQLMPLFVIDSMGNIPGLTGLFVAGIFSAALSTVSAAVNSLAAVTLEDYLKPLYGKLHNKPLPTHHTMFYTKMLALFYGLVCMGIAFLAQFLAGLLQAALTLFGAAGGPLLGLFTLGMFTTRSNQKGAITGLLVGLVFSFWIAFGGPRPPPPYLPVGQCGTRSTILEYRNSVFPGNETLSAALMTTEPEEYFYLYRLSYMWVGPLGFLCTTILGYVVSILTGSNTNVNSLNPDFYAPPFAKYLVKSSNIPRSVRKLSNSSQLSITKLDISRIPKQEDLSTTQF